MPSSSQTLVKLCVVKRCKQPRAVLVVNGTRKRARQCADHLSPTLQAYCEPVQGSKKREASRICGAKKRDGGVCTMRRGYGTDHPGYGRCKFHGGSHQNGRKAAAREEVQEQGILVMGLPIDVDPTTAILQCIRITAGEVVYSSQEIAKLKQDEAVVTFVEETSGENEFGNFTNRKESNDARLHIWIKTRQEAMDRLARYSKMAHDMGIAERQVKIAEELGGLIGRMVRGLLNDLGLTPEQERIAPDLVRRHLSVIEGKQLQMEDS